LLQHAHKWMEAAGGIRVTACAAELEGLEEWVRIQIVYTTTGEDSSSLTRAFDPSWDGNWEGLPFAYGLTKRMGGLMRAHMEPSRTAVFEVYLPSVEVAAAGAPLEAEDRPVLLVIDRNSEVRRLLHAHFEQHGYNVLEAANCEEGLLLADAFQRPIRLAIANPAPDDEYRADLAARLVALAPGICVRIIEGYRERVQSEDATEEETASRRLTKWELLEWANDALGAAAWLTAANSTS